MTSSRQFLLGLLAVGLQTGLAAAQTQLPASSLPAPAPTASAGPTAVPPPACGIAPECCDICNYAAGRTGLIGGVGLYLIKPYFDDNMAFGLQGTTAHSGGAPSRTDTRADISHQMAVAPLVWLGYIGDNGLGGRARWWTLTQGTNQSLMVPTGNGTSFQAISAAPLGLGLISGQGISMTSKLQVQVADLEALNDIRVGSWDILFAGGLRIARLNQGYNAFIPQGGANQLYSSNTFEGAGPTLALEARRALGTTGLSLYASGRGSVVFGSAQQFATQPDQNTAAADHRDPALPIGELELGMEYGRGVGSSWLFGQVALVGQQWFGAGSASRSSVNVVPGGGFNVGSYVGNSNLEFLGLSIRFGVNY